jgi:hypothetical protein
MRFQYLRPTGLCLPFMPMAFVVRLVGRRMLKGQKMCGLTADRLSTRTTKSANGKSFTIANVVVCGGLGATIGLRLNLENVPIVNPYGLFSIRWTIGNSG